ncbi:hypothetical protein ACN09X_08735 [Aliarcobacter butzleri]|uniref:hypothetical protein n=1 Tax=Aliarcobacter butzleri TaxID=28197 RepID=UPI003AED0127
MKIALIGNMNNNFFSITRYLRDLGCDAHLYYENNLVNHFLPESDTFQSCNKINYIHKINFYNYFFGLNKYKNLLAGYDYVIACGLHIGLLEREKIKIDIAIPYGSDLYEVTNPKFNFNKLKSFTLFYYLKNNQIKGFQNSRYIILNDEFDLVKKAAQKISLKTKNIGIPMIYNKEIKNDKFEKWSFLKDKDLVVFNHSRQLWKKNIFNISKGNNIIIEAFSKIVNEGFFKNPILVLFEYGDNVEDSKLLIRKFGIEHFVHWMPVMPRKEILQGLQNADFVANSFNSKEIDIGGVVYEGLASGSVVLNNMNNLPSNHIFTSSPVVHALEVEQIYAIFLDFAKNKSKYSKIRDYSKEWFDENLGLGLAKKYKNILESLKR